MKNFKLIIMGMMISCLLFILVNTFSYIKYCNKTIYFHNNKSYEEKMLNNNKRITLLKNKVLSESDKSCLKEIEELYNFSKKNYFTGSVSNIEMKKIIKTYSASDGNFYAKYLNVYDNCEQTEKEKEDNGLFSLTTNNLLNGKYFEKSLDYEFKILDNNQTQDDSDYDFIPIYSYMKIIESHVINNIISILEVKYE